MEVRLIVGLGNPGREYEDTRHNAGFWFLERLAARHGVVLEGQSRFHGRLGRAAIEGAERCLLVPSTFMNASGDAVAAVARFYKWPPSAIWVVHDDLDLPAGVARLKQGGGTGGHNGLASIEATLGSADYLRLRLGIGRPPPGREVIGYVLGRPPASERSLIDQAIDRVLDETAGILRGDWSGAMQRLHTGS